MSTKDPDIAKLQAHAAKLEKFVNSLILRVTFLEKEVKRLRGVTGRTNDQVGTMDRVMKRGK